MKPEKEFALLVKLLDSPFRGGFFKKSKSGCKKDFEKYLEVSENNKDFMRWLNSLITAGGLKSVGFEERGIGKKVNLYVVDSSVLDNILIENPCYKSAWNVFSEKAILGMSK